MNTTALNKIRYLTRNKDFMKVVSKVLSKKFSQNEMDTLTMTDFEPYIDIESNQYEFKFENDNINGFILFKSQVGDITILDFKKNHFQFVNFERVNVVQQLYQENSDKINQDDLFWAKSCLNNIQFHNKEVQERLNQKRKEEFEQQMNFNKWYQNGTNTVKHFELHHNQYTSTNHTYISLLEKEGEFKIAEHNSGCFSSNTKEITLDELNKYLKEDFTPSTIDALNETKILFIEKEQLEKRITNPQNSKSNLKKL